MAWKQILSPNLDNDPKHPLYVYQGGGILTDWYGWCLAVVHASFGAKGSSYSAKTAWQANSTKHRDYNLPEGVWIPVWWEGGQYGHVAEAYRQGDQITVYSSPYTHKPNFQVFKGSVKATLDSMGKTYGVGAFSGWSETLLDSRIISWVEDTKPVEPTPEPEPDPDPDPTPKPEPTPEPSDNDNKEDNMDNDKEPFDPAKEADAQLIGGLIEEASDCFEPSKTVKLIAYLIGDILLVSAIIIPDIVNAIQAPTMSIWAEYMSKVLLEAGTCILLVFKLIKKKK